MTDSPSPRSEPARLALAEQIRQHLKEFDGYHGNLLVAPRQLLEAAAAALDAKDRELATIQSALTALVKALEMIAHTCGDVTTIGRWGHGVDSINWVQCIEDYAKAALAARLATQEE